MSKRQRRVLLALGWYDYRLHEGIARYAIQQGWHLCPDTTKEKVIPWGWEGDGILAWLGAGDDLADFVVSAGKPTVDFSFRRPELPFARVLVDHAGAAQLVANHYLSRGFKHFLYYSEKENWAYEENGRAFINALEVAGRKCLWLCWEKSPTFTRGRTQWKRKRSWLAGELLKAPKPLAVFVATDDQAMDVLEACESAHIAVPGDVSIIGMDNSLRSVDAMRIPISSVDVNLEQVGRAGAALLQALMNGKPVPREPIRVPVNGLVARKSSDLVAVSHPGIARALKFMLEHFKERLTVEGLAQTAAMSARAFHNSFFAHTSRTPGVHLRNLRIEYAKKLLADSDQKIDTIAESCGYESTNSFWISFRRATGMSPKAYRDKASA